MSELFNKTVFYKGEKYETYIQWGGTAYVILINNKPSHAIPMEALNDMELLKKEFIKAIEAKSDLHLIDEWDGKIS
jgi:hypothetical protein